TAMSMPSCTESTGSVSVPVPNGEPRTETWIASLGLPSRPSQFWSIPSKGMSTAEMNSHSQPFAGSPSTSTNPASQVYEQNGIGGGMSQNAVAFAKLDLEQSLLQAPQFS